jgi:hypothetical protein
VNDRTITENEVRDEHQRAVKVPAHWAYLFGVIVGAFMLMVLFIAVLGRA